MAFQSIDQPVLQVPYQDPRRAPPPPQRTSLFHSLAAESRASQPSNVTAIGDASLTGMILCKQNNPKGPLLPQRIVLFSILAAESCASQPSNVTATSPLCQMWHFS